jgi:branched-chain amino acid transport system permease protein
MENSRSRNQFLWMLVLGAFAAFLYYMNSSSSDYEIRILIACAIFVVFAVSYNLINGVTGQFSLGPNAFAAVGAYTAALLTLSPAEKELSFIIDPIIWPLGVILRPLSSPCLPAGLLPPCSGS